MFVEANSRRWPPAEICKVLSVSESGYYRYRKNKEKPDRDALLSGAMKEILDEHPCNDNYGAPRMKQALAQRGIRAGLRRVTRLMRANGWLHTRKRRPKSLTKIDPEAMKSENLIRQNFTAPAPYQKLLTDVTQTQCADGTLYISPILDCFNGEILSLQMRDNMRKELCVDTVEAIKRYPLRGSILHSDRGSQYTSEAFREALEKQGLTFLSAEVQKIPQNTVEVTDPETIEKVQKMLDLLEESDDVQNVYHNAELPEEDED